LYSGIGSSPVGLGHALTFEEDSDALEFTPTDAL
jgi:hypothetical protein